jgi:hypothetical protein
MEEKGNKQVITTLAVLLVTVLVVIGVVAFSKKKTSSASVAVKSDTTTNTPTTPPTTTSGVAGSYKDGTYMARGDYATPADTESITLTVTLKNDTITDTTAKVSATSRESKEYAVNFANNYKQLVVGKKINAVKLSRVSGSSLTSQGFNDAILQIESQSKS